MNQGPLRRFFDGIFDGIEGLFNSLFRPSNSASSLQEIRERLDSQISARPADTQDLFGLLRLMLFFFILVLFSVLGGTLFENVDANGIALNLKMTNFFFRPVPMWLLSRAIFILHPLNARYMLMPLAASLAVIIGGGYYVADIYHLPNPRLGMRYVLASLFGASLPTLEVDGGAMVLKGGEINLIDAVGGPGYVIIQPGNAVLFRNLRRPSIASVTSSYFVSPFEMVGQIANLDDQHGFVPEVTSVTKDGIRVILRDINFRFRILPEERNQQVVQRSLETPFPFSQEAMQAMAYNLQVMENGLDPWRSAVQRSVVGTISDFVNTIVLDDLTAPRQNGLDPRGLIHDTLSVTSRRNLRNVGAELIWVDIGHFDIVPPEVDLKRTEYWSMNWQNQSSALRAEGEARAAAYADLARAEAQAEMIRSIVEALQLANPAGPQSAQVRRLILTSTAGVLDALRNRGERKS